MGVSYDVCAECGESFPDTWGGIWCECDRKYCPWCLEEMENTPGIKHPDGDEDEEPTCKYCRGEEIHDDQILPYLLKKYKLDVNEIKKDIKEELS